MLIFLVNILFGIGGGVSMVPLMAMAVKKGSRTSAMGSVMALLTMGHSIGMMAGAFGAGLIMDFFNLKDSFIFGTVVMAAGTLIFFFCTRIKARP